MKILNKIGFEYKWQHGNHIILKRQSDGKRFTIPDHKELTTGTLRAIIREAGLTIDEFFKLNK